MHKTSWGALLLVAILVVGCAPATRSVQPPEPDALVQDLSRTPLGTAEVSSAGFAEPTGGLTLRDALSAVLTNNPNLSVYSLEVRAAEAEALQAGLRPNPELTAELENFAGSGGFSGMGSAETTIALSQLIELGGKRAKRRDVGIHEQALASWDYEVARIEALTETSLAFIDVLVAQEQLNLSGDLVKVAEEVYASVSRRVQVGATSPVEKSRALVELETSRIEEESRRRALISSRTRLASLWGTTVPKFEEVTGDIEQLRAVPPREALESAVEKSPSLARWTAELDHRQAKLDLARADGRPDLTIGAGVRYFGDAEDAALVFGVGLPLPFFDRNQGASQAAGIRVRQAEEQRRAATVRILGRLAVAHETLLAASSEVQALRDRALPEADNAFQTAQGGYLRGSMRFTDVLDTQRLFFELKARYFEALARYHAAVSEIERLTGAPIASAPENPRRQ